jgi:4-aminobutyrate aminotransferase-like enzyme
VFVAPFPRPFEWHCDEASAVELSLRALERLLVAQTSPQETAAIVIEPVLGEGGYLPAPPAYLQGVREICDASGVLFVADEVQSGFGRTGKMFAVEHSDVVPDIVVMAKGIASGFPIAGIGASEELMSRWPQGAHGGTYGGNPIGCAAALATIEVIEEEHLVDNARDRGAQLTAALRELQKGDAGIGDVRGLGLMVGVELVDREGAPAAARTNAILRHCLDESNVIFMNCGTNNNVLRWMPPLVVTAAEIDRAVAAFAAALKATA